MGRHADIAAVARDCDAAYRSFAVVVASARAHQYARAMDKLDSIRRDCQSGFAAGNRLAVFRANNSARSVFAQSGFERVELWLELARLENRFQTRAFDDIGDVANYGVCVARIEYSIVLRELFSADKRIRFWRAFVVARGLDVLLGMVFSRFFIVRFRAGVSRKMGAICRRSAASRVVWLGAHWQTAAGNVRVVCGRFDFGRCRVAPEIVVVGVFDSRSGANHLGVFDSAPLKEP